MSLRRYLESWNSELTAKADRVRNLIGDANWLMDGFHREGLVREFLVGKLPSQVRISRGFILPDVPGAIPSGEIDILVVDSLQAMPWLNEGDLIISPPAPCLAQLHSKSSTKESIFAELFRSIAKAQSACAVYDPNFSLWSGCLFFEMRSPKKLDTIPRRIKQAWGSLETKEKDRLIQTMPIEFSTLSGQFGRIILSDGKVVIQIFEYKNLAAALLFFSLYEHVLERIAHKRPSNDWRNVFNIINPTKRHELEL